MRARARLVKPYLSCLIIKIRVSFFFRVIVKIVCKVEVQIYKIIFIQMHKDLQECYFYVFSKACDIME